MERFEFDPFVEEGDLLEFLNRQENIDSSRPKVNQQLLNAFNASPVAKNFGLTATSNPNTGEYVVDVGAWALQVVTDSKTLMKKHLLRGLV